MQIPNHENVVIAQEKIRDYLLSETHPIGRYKAAFFSSLGYSADSSDVLSADLLNLLVLDAETLESSEYGKKYEIRGSIHRPSGEIADIVSIWIIRSDESFPRFVTAYPE